MKFNWFFINQKSQVRLKNALILLFHSGGVKIRQLFLPEKNLPIQALLFFKLTDICKT